MAASAELAFARSIYVATADDAGQDCFVNILTGEVVWNLEGRAALVIPRTDNGQWCASNLSFMHCIKLFFTGLN